MWQNSEESLLQMAVVVAVRLAAGETALPAWDRLGTAVQLLLVSKPLLTPRVTNEFNPVEITGSK